MKFATFTSAGRQHYGAVSSEGMIALDGEVPDWPTLWDAVRAGGLGRLEQAAQGRAPTHRDYAFDMVLPGLRRDTVLEQPQLLGGDDAWWRLVEVT